MKFAKVYVITSSQGQKLKGLPPKKKKKKAHRLTFLKYPKKKKLVYLNNGFANFLLDAWLPTKSIVFFSD